MQVLLNENVKKLGYRGDVVEVKPGYFRNFLWPNGLAQVATKAVLKLTEQRKERMVMKKQEVVAKAEEVLAKLKGLTVTVKHKVNDSGKLYSAIDESEVSEAIKAEAGVELSVEFLKMEHFKELGEYDVVVSLAEGMEETVKVVVAAE